MSGYTPGPWVHSFESARLMAAAPEMFEALEMIRDADGFCALTLFEEGDFHKAAGIWSARAVRKPTAAELLAGAAPAMAAE